MAKQSANNKSDGDAPRRISLSENLAPKELSAASEDNRRTTNDDIYSHLSFSGGPAVAPAEVAGAASAVAGIDPASLILSPWVHAILLIRTDDAMTPVLETAVPSGRV